MLKMREVLLLVVGTVLVFMDRATAGTQTGVNLYGKRYSNLDVDTILNSDRLVRNYVDCLLSRKPCSPEGKELKRLLPEALRTKCSKCSQYQKESALRVLKKLYSTYPDYYNDLREKWDPNGEYHRKFEQYLQEEQFNSISDDHSQHDFYQTSSNNVNAPSFSLPAAVSSTTYRPTAETQRPARNPEGEQSPSVLLSTRFSDDDDDDAAPVAAPAVAPAPATRPPTIIEALFPNNGQNTQNAPAFNPFQPGTQGEGPFGLGIIKRIGNKISNTAEFFAEMVRNTVKVITVGLNRL